MMKLVLILLLIVHSVLCADDCPPNACQVKKYKCLSQDSCNGTLVPRAAACGCCPGCKPYLKEGDSCTLEELGSNSTTPAPTPSTGLVDINSVKAVCRPGSLTCLFGICVSIY